MSTKLGKRAPSGARLLGDDVQHLIVWYYVLRSQQPDSGIEQLSVEAPDAGNVDDLTLLRTGAQADEYWQIKASVDAKSPLDEAYLMELGKSGKSILQKLHASWVKLKTRDRPSPPRIVFATTKAIDPSDTVLSERATTDNRVCETLKYDDESRKRWADHLKITEPELMDFMSSVEIHHGQSEKEWKEKVQDVAATVHVQADAKGLATAVQQVRDWVKAPRSSLTPADLGKAISELGLILPAKSALIIVQMLEANPRAAKADVALDFINLFNGHDTASRRQLIDPSTAGTILEEIINARGQLREAGIYEAVVDGPMRLPMWFLVGKQLGNTAGMTVSARVSDQMWSSATAPASDAQAAVQMPIQTAAPGNPMAITINLATDISEDVDEFLAQSLPGTTRINISLARPGSRGIQDSAHAQAIALYVRDEVRALDRRYRPSEIHLFLAMPGPAALLIGHVWDRMPPTTIYWDLGRPGAYAPAFQVT